MNTETALPLDYAAQANPPARPSAFDASIRAKAVQSIVKDVADWLEEEVSNELIYLLTETMPWNVHIDGFKWAVALQDRYLFDGDSALVEILEAANLHGAVRDAVKQWVEANGITPKFAVGTRVQTLSLGAGTITRIDPEAAEYVIRTENRTWADNEFGYLIAFEHCSEIA